MVIINYNNNNCIVVFVLALVAAACATTQWEAQLQLVGIPSGYSGKWQLGAIFVLGGIDFEVEPKW